MTDVTPEHDAAAEATGKAYAAFNGNATIINETSELLTILPVIKRLDVPLIALTGSHSSTLARYATVTLDVSVPAEACPMNLAPTASTTATLAMGDALAIAVLEARGFTEEDFARSHPGGSLGRRLLLHVEDVMRKGQHLPRVGPDALLSEGLLEMSRKGLGMTAIVGPEGRLLGIFTDGDLRRTIESGVDIRTAKVESVVSRIVCASAGDFATSSVAGIVLPPGRFSTTTGCAHWGPRRSASCRARTSMPPPGGYATTMRTGRAG